jgi:DNA helicase-2/ATP-dependent DNA helicase PcrA
MKIIADFHVHSKYSRATAKNSDLENLYISAQLKGINVIGTGDFTHPGWFNEIETKLIPAEEGLFKLREDIAAPLNKSIPGACRGDVRFILTSEISNIYKKNGKTRKNHNLVFIPDLSTAAEFNAKLEKIGNIHSDGRPILGLDAKHLLEIVLETAEKNFLVPAHIWTPWFSLLGSKSGFDTIEECFEDLTDYIFAVETGLSSDPPMNWRIKFLDGLTLISNSDAHSPNKLGREANLFDTEMSFNHIRQAMEGSDPKAFLGTLEFYPEEGKYHLDGHRKCNVRSWPQQTVTRDGICPVCQKPMTLGVLYRVEELADRAEGSLPDKRHAFQSIIPLREILSAILGVGPNTKKVSYHYDRLLNRLGPELDIVNTLSIDQIDAVELPHLSEAIHRVRHKKISINPGYDGEFGTIGLFDKKEKEIISGQKKLFNIPKKKGGLHKNPHNSVGPLESKRTTTTKRLKKAKKKIKNHVTTLNEQQHRAVHHGQGPLIIVAGPGTGKTLTITHRIAHLIESHQANPENILALTFTNKAAEEMHQRLKKLLGDATERPLATTFHAFCIHVLQEIEKENSHRIVEENEQHYFFEQAVKTLKKSRIDVGVKTRDLRVRVAGEKQQIRGPHKRPGTLKDVSERIFQQVYKNYQKLLLREHLWDFEDLIYNVVTRFDESSTLVKQLQKHYKFIFVDEYQDINFAQYRVIKHLAPRDSNICVIGDPDQSIYGFRGSDVRYFNQFTKDYPQALSVNLSQNYRSVQVVLKASLQMMGSTQDQGKTKGLFSKIDGPESIGVLPCENEQSEAVAIGKEIENLVGGLGFYSIDFEKTNTATEDYSFSDFAVLFRTGRQCELFADIFKRAGIPFQIASKEEAFFEKSVNLVLSFLKILEKSGSYMDMERVIQFSGSGLGQKTVKTWTTWAFENNYSFAEALENTNRFPVNQMKRERQSKFVHFIERISRQGVEMEGLNLQQKINFILENSLIRDKVASEKESRDVLEKFIKKSKQYRTAAELFQASALQTDTDLFDSNTEKVSLMTLHASKGLEFPVVFVSGCEEGYIPFKRQEGESENTEEERRLLYVAMTRAQQVLFLSYAKKRKVFGKRVPREPSRFIRDIEQNLKNYRHVVAGRFKKKGHTQLELFSI